MCWKVNYCCFEHEGRCRRYEIGTSKFAWHADIRKHIHALDDEDNYDTVGRKYITHSDFCKNFLKSLFGAFLRCLFYYSQWLRWSLGIPRWCNSLAIWHGVKTLENVPCTVQRSRTAMSTIVDFLSSMVLDTRKQRNYMASIAVTIYTELRYVTLCYVSLKISRDMISRSIQDIYFCR